MEGVGPAREGGDEGFYGGGVSGCSVRCGETLRGRGGMRDMNVRESIPATPQRPKPELRIVDPLLMSATASSADLKSFEPPRLFAVAASVAEYRGLHVLKARRGERGDLLRV